MHSATQFIDPTSVMFAKLLLAMLLGAILGTERAVLGHQAAGTRTFGLVSLGACLFIIVNNYVNSAYIGVVDFQPTYVAAAIVTGIGFIGGGLIILRGDSLHGVTTAAGLWIAAALGVAVGYSLYAVAIWTVVLSLVMFVGMWWIEDRFKHWFVQHENLQHPQAPGSSSV